MENTTEEDPNTGVTTIKRAKEEKKPERPDLPTCIEMPRLEEY